MATLICRILAGFTILTLCGPGGISVAQNSVTQTPRLFLPSVQVQRPPAGVVGYLTENGKPAVHQTVITGGFSNFPLTGPVAATMSTAVTDASGFFQIDGNFGEPGRPSTTFLVAWQNPDANPNRIDHIWVPFSNYDSVKKEYSQISVGTIEIASPVLISPANGASVTLPAEFTFTPVANNPDCNVKIIDGFVDDTLASGSGLSGRITVSDLRNFRRGVAYKWRISCWSGNLESVSRDIVFR